MKTHYTFSLTLLSTLVLTACGSSGGSSSTQSPPQPKTDSPKVIVPQPQPKAEEQPKVVPQPPKVEEQPKAVPQPPKAEEQPKVVPQPPKVEEQPKVVPQPPKIEEQPKVIPQPPKVEEQPKVVPQPPKVEEQPKIVPQPPKVEEQPKVVPQPPKVEEQPKVVPQPPKAEESPKVVPQPPKVEEQPKVEPQPPKVEEQPKVEPPLPKEPEQPKTLSIEEQNNQIFTEKLSSVGNNFEALGFFELAMDDGRTVKINYTTDRLYEDSKQSNIIPLFDKNQKLLGYYGYVALTAKTLSDNGYNEDVPVHKFFGLQSSDYASQQLPAVSDEVKLKYEGKMFYARNNENLLNEADVSAYYHSKKLNMNIHDKKNNIYWTSKDAQVNEHGQVAGKLKLGSIAPDGEFNVAFYGTGSEALIGKAHSEQSTGWKGVIGAELKETIQP